MIIALPLLLVLKCNRRVPGASPREHAAVAVTPAQGLRLAGGRVALRSGALVLSDAVASVGCGKTEGEGLKFAECSSC